MAAVVVVVEEVVLAAWAEVAEVAEVTEKGQAGAGVPKKEQADLLTAKGLGGALDAAEQPSTPSK
ncbi:hypothetical protein LTR66_013572 [Elasticomyces elasticus]|nr:hypothetical protein LTR66_013572 [Elasticomyces elasticus]